MGSAGLDHPRLSQPQSAARAGADAPPFGARTGAYGDAAASPGRTAVRCGRPYHAAAGDRAGGGRGGRGEPASRAQAESNAARATSAPPARVAVVAGRNVIGIELPNPTREMVYLREQLASRDYVDSSAKLPLCLGKTIGGEPVIVDLARMPHLLIAGTTGSGKSVAINTMILSLLYRLRPDQCRLIMVDPKMLEL